jgi:hypothetical protein
MKVKCITPEGVESETRCEWAHKSAWNWGHYISEDCEGFTDKIQVVDTSTHGTKTIGTTFDLVF